MKFWLLYVLMRSHRTGDSRGFALAQTIHLPSRLRAAGNGFATPRPIWGPDLEILRAGEDLDDPDGAPAGASAGQPIGLLPMSRFLRTRSPAWISLPLGMDLVDIGDAGSEQACSSRTAPSHEPWVHVPSDAGTGHSGASSWYDDERS